MTVKYVIQCAARKVLGAGTLSNVDGKPVKFVANPELYQGDEIVARPDDLSENGKSWRQILKEYNQSGENPHKLKRAFELYNNPAYRDLVDRFGIENVYILSAGWGLVPADFLLPDYNITFSNSAMVPNYAKRKKSGKYADFCKFEANKDDTLVFIGGKDYQQLFVDLTAHSRASKVIIYNSKIRPKFLGIDLREYATKTRTNWHYELANDLVSGKFHF